MTVKIGETFSSMRAVMGGVPQGSLLGVMLFNLSIDNFEAHFDDVKNYGQVELNMNLSSLWGKHVPREPPGRDYTTLAVSLNTGNKIRRRQRNKQKM